MAHVITTKDGKNHTLFDERDLFSLMEEYAGDEARRWLEDYFSDWEAEHSDDAEYIKELEAEIKHMQEHRKETARRFREQSEFIAGLICEKDIDRRALSSAAGKISQITWRELNV